MCETRPMGVNCGVRPGSPATAAVPRTQTSWTHQYWTLQTGGFAAWAEVGSIGAVVCMCVVRGRLGPGRSGAGRGATPRRKCEAPDRTGTDLGTVTGQNDVDRVRDATDLAALIGEHIPLQRKGREHVCLCPFHDDHRPSMSVVTHKGNAFYKCHSCGAAGDAFNFVMQYLGKEFPEALQYLADRAGITLQKNSSFTTPRKSDQPTRATLREVTQRAATFFRRTLLHAEDGRAARDILAERGITDETAEQFNIGLAPDAWDALTNAARRKGIDEKSLIAAGLLKQRKDGTSCYDTFRNRLIFPICDDVGHPIAFGGRRIDADDEPKYLNSAESAIFHKSKTLYALHLARQSIMETGKAIVTEGYTDVIACHQAGVTNVVGTLGTSLTTRKAGQSHANTDSVIKEHAKLLARICDTVIMVFDGDEAGQRAADRAVEAFFTEPVDIRICTLPDGCDPDDLLKQQHGVARFHEAIEAADDALAYKTKRFRSELATAVNHSARQKKLETFLAELANLGFNAMPGVRKRPVLLHLADLLAVPPHTIEQIMPRTRRRTEPTVTTSASEPDQAPPPSTVYNGLLEESPMYVSRARRLAERELLALLLYDPRLCAATQLEIEGAAQCVHDIFTVDDFVDPSTRAIGDLIFQSKSKRSALRLQDVLAALEDPDARHLASDLYFHVERQLGDDHAYEERFIELLRSAAGALRSRIKVEQYEQQLSRERAYSPGSDNTEDEARAVLERIQRRSEHAFLPAAISQGLRE